jgi:hypothetical protein
MSQFPGAVVIGVIGFAGFSVVAVDIGIDVVVACVEGVGSVGKASATPQRRITARNYFIVVIVVFVVVVDVAVVVLVVAVAVIVVFVVVVAFSVSL